MTRKAKGSTAKAIVATVLLGSSLAAPAAGGTSVSEPVTVDLQVSRSDRGLKLSYTVHNHSAEKVYLLDQMVALRGGAYVAQPDGIVVQAGGAGTVDFVRGYVDPGHPVQVQYPPAARGLEPGKSLTGSAEVAWPLHAQHPYGRLPPLPAGAKSATLRIGYVSGQVQWQSYPLATGGSLTAPQLPSAVSLQRFARSAAAPLPAK